MDDDAELLRIMATTIAEFVGVASDILHRRTPRDEAKRNRYSANLRTARRGLARVPRQFRLAAAHLDSGTKGFDDGNDVADS